MIMSRAQDVANAFARQKIDRKGMKPINPVELSMSVCSMTANAQHPHSKYMVILKMHKVHKDKVPLDIVLSTRALATEVRHISLSTAHAMDRDTLPHGLS